MHLTGNPTYMFPIIALIDHIVQYREVTDHQELLAHTDSEDVMVLVELKVFQDDL